MRITLMNLDGAGEGLMITVEVLSDLHGLVVGTSILGSDDLMHLASKFHIGAKVLLPIGIKSWDSASQIHKCRETGSVVTKVRPLDLVVVTDSSAELMADMIKDIHTRLMTQLESSPRFGESCNCEMETKDYNGMCLHCGGMKYGKGGAST